MSNPDHTKCTHTVVGVPRRVANCLHPWDDSPGAPPMRQRTVKKKLRPLGFERAQEKVDPRTFKLRAEHPETMYECAVTQIWKWDGGDAIVIVTRKSGDADMRAHVVIRNVDDVRVLKADGLHDAMRQIGLDPLDFEIEVAPDLEA